MADNSSYACTEARFAAQVTVGAPFKQPMTGHICHSFPFEPKVSVYLNLEVYKILLIQPLVKKSAL